MKKELIMKYNTPASKDLDGWEKHSLPLGNGFFGANVFGGMDTDLVVFATNEFACDYNFGGVSCFSRIYVDYEKGEISNYQRGLNLSRGFAYTNSRLKDKNYNVISFISYKDKVFVYKVNADKPFSVSFKLEIPYLGSRPVSEGGRTGEIYNENDEIVMRGTLPFRDLIFEGRMAVLTDGTKEYSNDSIIVKDTKEVTLIYTLGTSYKLDPKVFYDNSHKAIGPDPHEKVLSTLSKAKELGYEMLYDRHNKDYKALFDRVSLDLKGKEDERSVPELLDSYRKGNDEPYLEELYYQYGRYLLISSSRKGSTPASLQGVWTYYDKSPWGSGFWHNINVQMNYWHAFSTNLKECFYAYADFFKAYLKMAERHASKWIKEISPENYNKDIHKNGWIIGTGAYSYEIEGMNFNTHSGPGTGGMTAKMFSDFYDFTMDKNVLNKYTYPAVHGMATFLIKNVSKYDDKYLIKFSASPEQILSGDIWVSDHKMQKYYHTVGCAFDEQMITEIVKDDLRLSKELNISDEITEKEKEQNLNYSAINIGSSGQIKEYLEEDFYGEIGEFKHRHLSELVALMPGSLIGSSTPAYLDSAKETLRLRGDESTGWALAHRLNAWARTMDSEHSYLLLKNLLKFRTFDNLWDMHPPFQIDGNFGATSGMTEMLLQSHEGYINLLPSVPKAWKNISFKGLVARGNFNVSLKYSKGIINKVTIKSNSGSVLKIKNINNSSLIFKNKAGELLYPVVENDIYIINTNKNDEITIINFNKFDSNEYLKGFNAEYKDKYVELSWDKTNEVAILRSIRNESNYTYLGRTKDNYFKDYDYSLNNKERLTYKIVPIINDKYNELSNGAVTFINKASKLELDRYKYRVKVNNLHTVK